VPRIPGSPDKKLALLSTIDYKTLPYLVGDVLYFLRGHNEVQVVDGPGDGKRDVHSVKPDGSRHVTQCKYHQDVHTTVSSDETDQIILALAKFGCKCGLFVTTGKISPQAKREYLDNYPDFELDFIDGTGLVDAVLASPILSAVWFDGVSLTQARSSLRLPFVLRIAQTDQPWSFKKFTEVNELGLNYKFNSGTYSRLDFEPYRPPVETTQEENESDWLQCYEVLCPSPIRVHEISENQKVIAKIISKQVDEAYLPLIIRFGVPSLAANAEVRCDDRVKIPQVRPTSFVIDKNRAIIAERDWVVLGNHDDWIFPENLSCLGASWAGWLSRLQNTIVMQELVWPSFDPEPYFTQQRLQIRQKGLGKSLFLAGNKPDCDAFKNRLSKKEWPNWSCPYGPNGVLLGWLHPALEAEKIRDSIHKYKEDEYDALIHRIESISSKTSLTKVPDKQAVFIAAAAGEELLPTPKESRGIGSAELVHCYGDVPSPVYLKNREFMFIQMWRIPKFPSVARKTISSNPLTLNDDVSIFMDVKRGYKTKETFLLSSLIFPCPANISSDEYFDAIKDKRDTYFNKIAEYIQSFWAKAELATEFFWRTELGFQIDDSGFRDNPWVMLFREGEKPTIIFHTPSNSVEPNKQQG
jgi:hypothetical protein